MEAHLSVTQIPWDLTLFSILHGHCMHTVHVQTHTHTHIQVKINKSAEAGGRGREREKEEEAEGCASTGLNGLKEVTVLLSRGSRLGAQPSNS